MNGISLGGGRSGARVNCCSSSSSSRFQPLDVVINCKSAVLYARTDKLTFNSKGLEGNSCGNIANQPTNQPPVDGPLLRRRRKKGERTGDGMG